jgi:hypothetical protein
VQHAGKRDVVRVARGPGGLTDSILACYARSDGCHFGKMRPVAYTGKLVDSPS